MDNTFSTDTAQLGFSVGSDHIMVREYTNI